MARKINLEYLRSSIFGIEDALVSTTGVVAGLTVGAQDKKILILSGFVYIAVEAISMGAGQFLTEKTVHEAEKGHTDNPIIGAIIMFLSYFLAGLIPFFPAILLPMPIAIGASITAALVGLFVLGYIKGNLVKVPPTRSGLEMVVVGGIACLSGVVVGWFLKL